MLGSRVTQLWCGTGCSATAKLKTLFQELRKLLQKNPCHKLAWSSLSQLHDRPRPQRGQSKTTACAHDRDPSGHPAHQALRSALQMPREVRRIPIPGYLNAHHSTCCETGVGVLTALFSPCCWDFIPHPPTPMQALRGQSVPAGL